MPASVSPGDGRCSSASPIAHPDRGSSGGDSPISFFDASEPLCQPKCMKQSVDLSGTAFCDVDGTGYAGDFIAYLDQAADHFGSLKVFTNSLLRARPGEWSLDVENERVDDVSKLAT